MWTGHRHEVIGSHGPGPARRFLAGLAVLALVAGCGGSAAAVPPGEQALDGDAPADPEAITLAASTAGRWVNAGDLSSGRLAPRTVLLGDGRVLVVGDDGCDPESNGATSTEVEVWDASTNRWQKTADLASPRARFVALPLRDGRVLVTGGMDAREGSHNSNPYVSYSSAWAYSARTGTWSRAGIMRQARTDPAGAVLRDGRVLVAGGYYASDRWRSALSVNSSPREVPMIELVVSRSGVLADVAPDTPPAPVLATAELYDPATNTWSATGSMAVPRYGASAVTLSDGRVLIVGQRVAWGGPYDIRIDQRAYTVAEIYDPKTGRFRLAGTLPTPMVNGALVALADGGALLVGGYTKPDDGPALPVRTTLRFGARALTWTATGRLATARSSAVAVRLRDGRVLVAGGYDAYVPTKTAELYDPATGKWTAAPPMPAPRGGGAAVVLRDGSVLIVGGLGAHSHDSQYSACWAWNGLARAVRFIPTP